MKKTIEEFYAESGKYIELFNAFALKHELAGKAQADHVCYKCESSASFESLRALFENESRYMFQSIISGRRISYIRFKEGIETRLGTINFLELSDQKPDGSQQEGFDHIEVFPTTFSYEEMLITLSRTEEVVHVERPHHTTDDVLLNNGFLFRCTRGPLIEKIKENEML